MNGGGSKPERYCKITVYLQHNAPLLYENIQDLCMFGAFNTRGRDGVTFLLPDKKTQEKIDKTVGTDSRKAVAMINACVLPVFIENIGAFKSQQDDIPNRLGNKLPIKEVTSSSVVLSNGSKITVDSKFKRLYDSSNTAVYNIDGEVPTTGEATKVLGVGRSSKRGAKGGNDSELSGTRGKDGMSKHAVITEAREMANLRNKTHKMDHLTHLTISLLTFMLENNKATPSLKEFGELLCKVMPFSPFYCLFILLLMEEDEITLWIESPKEYDKLEQLKKFLNMGFNKHDEVNKKFKQKSDIMKMNGTNSCDDISANMVRIVDHLMPNGDNNFDRFGGKSEFCNWLLAVTEFSYLYTEPYINAYMENWEKANPNKQVYGGYDIEYAGDGENKIVKRILDSFDRFVVQGCTNSWKGALTMFNPLLDTSPFSKEIFCTRLGCYMSQRFPPMGGDLEQLANIDSKKLDGKPLNGVLYGTNFIPTTIVPMSDEHNTAKFWLASVK